MSDLEETGATFEAAESTPASSEPKEVRVVSESELSRRADADLDAKLAKVFETTKKEKSEPEVRRDPSGKFQAMTASEGDTAKALAANAEPKAPAKADPKADPKSVEEPKAEVKGLDKTPVAKHEAPKHWPETVKSKFAALPEDVQKDLAEAGLKDRQIITKMGQDLKAYEPVGKLLNEYKDIFEGRGTVPQGLESLMKAQKALDTNPVEALKQIASAYKVDLSQLANGQQAGFQLPPDPEVSALKTEIANLKKQLGGVSQHITQSQQHAYENQVKALAESISAFGKDKDGFDEIEADFEVQFTALRRANPSLTLDALMAQAYDAAYWANPKMRARALEKEHKASEEKRLKALEEARRANAINVNGSPKANGHADTDTLLSAIWDKRHAA